MTILVAKNLTDGHRGEYLTVIEEILRAAGTNVCVRPVSLSLIFTAEPVFFMMIEEAPMPFFLVALLRALVGLRTAGLLFRPGECIAPTKLRLILKRAALKLLRRLPRSAVITILPFSLERGFENIAKFGIYDPQLWDLKGGELALPPQLSCDLVSEIDRLAGARRVMVALGAQNLEKGFDFFCKIWCAPDNSALREQFLFVSGGKVAASCADDANNFAQAGGLIWNRHLTSEELWQLYRRADIVWCGYSPHYNQASGIFGRAVQYGKPAVIRSGSYIGRLAGEIGHPVVNLDWDDTVAAQNSLLSEKKAPLDPAIVEASVARMRKFSLDCLQKATGIVLRVS